METVTIKIFIDRNCPYCNYVQKYILEDFIARRKEISRRLTQRGLHPLPFIDLKVIDVDANMGTKEEQFFSWYSQKVGGRYTPVILIKNKAFYLWGKDKPRRRKEEQLSKTDFLKKQLIETFQEIYETTEKQPFYKYKEPDFVGDKINAKFYPFQ